MNSYSTSTRRFYIIVRYIVDINQNQAFIRRLQCCLTAIENSIERILFRIKIVISFNLPDIRCSRWLFLLPKIEKSVDFQPLVYISSYVIILYI